MSKAKNLKARAIAEMKAFVFISIYLAFLFGSFADYRRLISSEYHVSYLHYGYAIIEALVLAKVILIGRMLRLGDRFGDLPLIIPALYKTLLFSMLVMAFSILEYVIEGLWHHHDLNAIAREMADTGRAEILARLLILYTALVPLFILMELDDFLGAGKLFALFFRRRRDVYSTLQSDAGVRT